jgi:formylmethanofuran dehydrogenase subunit A
MGKLLHVAPSYDHAAETDIAQWFEDCYSIRFRNYAVGDDYSHAAEQIECG